MIWRRTKLKSLTYPEGVLVCSTTSSTRIRSFGPLEGMNKIYIPMKFLRSKGNIKIAHSYTTMLHEIFIWFPCSFLQKQNITKWTIHAKLNTGHIYWDWRLKNTYTFFFERSNKKIHTPTLHKGSQPRKVWARYVLKLFSAY